MKFRKEENDNFWIAYADLMAGLLFVFILLVGGVIVKYFLTQSSLHQKESDYLSTMALLQNEKDKNSELEAINKIFSDKLNQLNIEVKNLKSSNSVYVIQIEELKKLASDLESKNVDLDSYIKNLLEQNKQKDEKISENEVKIAYFLEQITQKDRDLNRILNDLNITKNRIKNLTGIQVNLISEIKEKLGNQVEIDQQTGALTLSSAILFDKGSYKLRDDIKESLKQTLENYFAILMQSDYIRKNLDAIIIEGHTDSDGEYMFNLELSQQRAFAVMEFINSWNKDERLKQYLTASGRSYMEPIVVNGVEDKGASRRIEIKFLISNRQSIEEIKKFLQYDENRTN